MNINQRTLDGIKTAREDYKIMAFIRTRGNYCLAIIHRMNCTYQPYVFCKGYDVTDGTWGAGTYCETYEGALREMCAYMTR